MKINDPLGFGFISIFLRFGDQGAKRWRDRVSRAQIIFRKRKTKRVQTLNGKIFIRSRKIFGSTVQ